jgi:hypothetical protein
MTSPQSGDLVLIGSAPSGKPVELVGTLVEIERLRIDRGWGDDGTWDEEAEGRPCPTEPIYVLRTLDGGTFRWENVSVHALPLRRFPARTMIDDPEMLTERPATLTEQAESLFRAERGDYTPLGTALAAFARASRA